MPKRQKGKKRKKTKEPREPQDLKRIKRYGGFTTPISKDVLLLVFQYFNLVDLANARLVCRDFDRAFVSHKETILHSVYCQTYGLPKLETARSASWSQMCAVRARMARPTEEEVTKLITSGFTDNFGTVDVISGMMREFKCRTATRDEMKEHKIPEWMILGTCFPPESKTSITEYTSNITQGGLIKWTLFAPSGKMIDFSFEPEIFTRSYETTIHCLDVCFETGKKEKSLLIKIYWKEDKRKKARQYFDELIADIGMDVPPEIIRQYITICSHYRYTVEEHWKKEKNITKRGWPDFYYLEDEKPKPRKKKIESSSESEDENSDDE